MEVGFNDQCLIVQGPATGNAALTTIFIKNGMTETCTSRTGHLSDTILDSQFNPCAMIIHRKTAKRNQWERRSQKTLYDITPEKDETNGDGYQRQSDTT